MTDTRADLVARRLLAAREASRATTPTGIPRRPPGVDVPSPQQESIWLADRVAGGTGEYNVSQVLRVRGPLDEDALRLAVGIVMERHEVLRTRYATRDGRPVPVVGELSEVPVTVSEAAGPEAATARAAELAGVPFDLATDAPIRAHLLRVAADDRLLVLVLHHIAVDGWAVGVLCGELSDIYAALVAGNVPARPDLPVQYADYAHWQRERLAAGRADRDLDYWRARLAGLVPAELPTDAPPPDAPPPDAPPPDAPHPAAPPLDAPPTPGAPPPADTRRSPAGRLARRDVAVPDALAADVHRVAGPCGATAFHVLLATFQALLARLTGGTDVAVGTLLAARDHAALEGLIGFFGTTVVIRTDLSGDPTLAELVAAVRDAAFAAQDHADLPFDRVVAALRPVRDPARHPLFQVMFTLADDEAAPLRLTDCAIEALPVAAGPAKFDLEVIVTRSQGPDGAPRLAVTLEYATGRFTPAAVDRIAAAYLRLLAQLVADPDRPVGAAELLPPAERDRLTGEFNATATPFPRDALVHELIAAQVARTPDAVAVHTGRGDAMTYAALDARANRLAHRLRDAGAGPDATVGVSLPRSPDLVVALLAVLKTGAAYVPVDPDHPADRVAHVLADSRARLLVTDAGAPAVDLDGITAVDHDRITAVDLDRLDGHPDTPLPRAATPEDLAYLIYTSGSTGRPKGVMVPHRAVVNLSLAYAELMGLAPGDIVGAVATHAFDLSVPELLTTLMTGATIALAPRAVATDGAALGRFLDTHGVTVMQTTPTTWRMLLDAGWAGGPLRAGASGEPVPADLAAALSARVARMWCLYGPTETTVWSTGAPVADVVPGRLMPVGRPLANQRVHVCDDRMRLVPIGVVGEICIGGDGVSRGYAHQPALTADRYVPDPFTPGGRLYRSGDLGRVRADGVVEFVGRADTQVKIRGNRVELGEVEAVLSGHPQVAAAAARTWGEGPDIRLVAYAVWRGEPVGAEEIRAHLRTRLPDAMLPTVVVDLAEMPLTPNFKVDRRALPPPPDATATAHVPPRTDREQLVVDIWSAVLDRDGIGVDDDFFALGGHSLRGLAVTARLGAATGVDIPLRTLFAHPTPRRLAAALGEPATGARPAPVARRPDGAPAPLSAVQRRLWFLDRLRPGHGEYQVPSVTRLRGRLDADRLAAAIGEVAAAHDALRVRFVDGDTAELVAPAEVTVTEAAGGAEARAIAEADAAQPFDLGAGPPLRARVIRIADDDHVIVLVAHHAAVDGWSLRLIRSEIAARYAGDAPPPPALDYRDHAYAQANAPTDLAHWPERLAGLPACELPTDAPRPATWSGRAGRVAFALPDGASEALRALARDRRATVFMVLLAAFEAVVAWFAGQDEVVLGTPVAGRTRPEFDDLVGCFVNTMVVRGDTGGDPTFGALVDRVRDALLADLQHQDVPFERLVDALRPERDLGRNPLFQIMFRADDTAPGGPGPGGTRAEPWDLAPAGAKFDLNVAVDDTADRIAGTIEYAADLFDAVTAERVARAYTALLAAAARQPEARLSALCDASTGERPAGTGRELLPERVARAARLAPDATAVVHGDARVDYATLDGRANRIAHALRDRGIRAGDIVAVSLPRTPELVATLLGVLRAGAAYLPLDPAAPVARRDAMLAGAKLLLTDAPWNAPVPTAAPAEGTDPEPPRLHRTPDDPFAVFFTSGSTGQPKGVVTLHRGVAAFLDYLSGPVGLHAADTVLQLAAVTFDASVRDMLAPLALGATVVLADDARDPYRLRAAMAAHRVTVIASAVPTLLRMLTTADGEATPDLRLVLASGEPLTRDLVRAVHRLAPAARVINQYGPTETTMISTWYAVDDDAGDAPVPIGRPIPGAVARVLSPTGTPLPVGALGELHLAGPGLTGGYLGAPAATADAFRPDPHGPPGARMYRTGDRARLRPDGMLEFHGRRDQQVKIRGVRVEPGEVEAALSACPGVRGAAVVAHGDVLAGYVAADPGLDLDDVMRHLADLLPEHLIPATLYRLDALPVTAHGKLDRAALPVPADARREPGLAARDVRELRMSHLWEQVLGHRVGVRENFFAEGGTSLRAVELVEAVRREFGAAPPLHAVFRNPTVESLCAALGDTPDELVVPLAHGPAGTPPLFLVHPQGGDCCAYLPLAAELADVTTVYGVESVGYNADEAPLATIEEMAERYLTEIVKVAPDGPYRLAGWSFGGNVAFEVAARLEAAGHDVGFVGVIDARAFGTDRLEHWSQQRGEVERFGVIAELPPEDLAALAAAEAADDEREAMTILLRDARRRDAVPRRADTATLRRMVAVFSANGRAADRYRTDRRLAARIHLFKASAVHPTLTNPVVEPASWAARTEGGLRVVKVDGNHHDLVRPPHVASLAAAFREALIS